MPSQIGYNQPGGFDRTRGYAIGRKDFTLEHLEEAYTTENWLVRIYKVKHTNNRPHIRYKDRQIKGKRSARPAKASGKAKKGVLRTQPGVGKAK